MRQVPLHCPAHPVWSCRCCQGRPGCPVAGRPRTGADQCCPIDCSFVGAITSRRQRISAAHREREREIGEQTRATGQNKHIHTQSSKWRPREAWFAVRKHQRLDQHIKRRFMAGQECGLVYWWFHVSQTDMISCWWREKAKRVQRERLKGIMEYHPTENKTNYYSVLPRLYSFFVVVCFTSLWPSWNSKHTLAHMYNCTTWWWAQLQPGARVVFKVEWLKKQYLVSHTQILWDATELWIISRLVSHSSCLKILHLDG